MEPNLPDIADAIQQGYVHHCGICEGYESQDKRLGVIGHASSGLHEALFLRTYSTDITLLSLGCPLTLSDEERQRAKAAGIEIIEDGIASVVIRDGKIRSMTSDARRQQNRARKNMVAIDGGNKYSVASSF